MNLKVTLILLGLYLGMGAQAQEVNVLGWCDNGDPDLIAGFEAQSGARVNFKETDGTGVSLGLVQQSRPGDWDVIIIDSVDVPRVAEAGVLEPLNPEDYPWDDFFEEAKQEELHYQDGVLYALPEKFGYNTIAYNKENVDPEDMLELNTLWSEDYAGRLALNDYYIPAIELVALSLGIKPTEITMDNLPQIRERLLALKDNAVSVGGIVANQTALVTGEVDVVFSGGEYAVANLMAENPELDWVLPNEGGMRWQQAIGVVSTSESKDLATQFVQYVVSPEGQAHLATSECFWAMPVNSKAPLSDEEKAILRWDEQADFLPNSYDYFIPDAEMDAAFLELWTEMLQY